jgi:hypothetical protein
MRRQPQGEIRISDRAGLTGSANELFTEENEGNEVKRDWSLVTSPPTGLKENRRERAPPMSHEKDLPQYDCAE